MRIEYCEEKVLTACLTYKTGFEEIIGKPAEPEEYHGKYARCKQDFDNCIEQNKVR
jgi:hypothetical protein